ncbi:condensation domain-containing protein [Micromonospora sp. DR5-3]|uniref:condensation domain-containing protein n=1 Tax=unclassified Micromonospora TaxID=2617518 RepID=UPI0016520F64|nr:MULTISPECIES: condensation domain-containing protein [unclassified Micromonospora]MCW3816379.1 condensation domain-containing protein [Micromonospora sp. DR5-3]
MVTSAPLTFGQLAIWRDVESVPRDRWHEPNIVQAWELPAGTGTADVRAALAALVRRHESLRTTYDLSDPAAPRQVPHPPRTPDVAVQRAADPRVDLDTVREQLARQPFSLVREPAWRATVVAAGDAPTHLVLVHHHMVADGLATWVLRRDFLAALAGTLDDAVSGPRTIVAHEQSPAGQRRGAAAMDYWAKLLTEVPPPAVGQPPFVEARLVSRALAGAARRVAARLRVSVANVVLSAFCAGLFAVGGDDRLLVRVLSSNRFDPYRRDVVTSMNQWIPVLFDRPSGPGLADLVREVVTRTRVAYAHGVYDVDRAFRLLDEAGYRRGQYDSTWSVNFIARRADEPEPSDPDLDAAEDATVSWAAPFSSVGPRRYLRVIEGTDLTCELRVPVGRSAVAAELLRRMRQALLDADRAG